MTLPGFITQWSTCNDASLLPGILFPLEIIWNRNCYLVIAAHAIDFAKNFILFTTTVFLAKHVLHFFSRILSFLFHCLTGIDSILKSLHVKSRDCDLLLLSGAAQTLALKRRSMKISGNMRQHRCCLPGYEAGSLVHNIPDLRRRINNSYHRLCWCCFLFWLLFWL